MNNELKEYIENRVNEFKENLINEIEDKIEKEKENKSIWDLDINNPEKYYAVDSSGGIYKVRFSEKFDENVRLMGNAFLTREEAKFEVERRKVEAIMRRHSRPYKPNDDNYIMIYNEIQDSIYVHSVKYSNYGIPAFESIDIAQQVIDEIGKYRLKKYWFRTGEINE